MRTHITTGDIQHIPVLLHETVAGLALTPHATVIDATLGSGGHFREILAHLGPKGTLMGIDADETAVARLRKDIDVSHAGEDRARLFFVTGNFRHIVALAQTAGITTADAIVADLGWRAEQFSGDKKVGGGKGFSFAGEEPLHMTFGDPTTYHPTAEDIVLHAREEDIVTILKGYGEERFARRIARAIVQRRESRPIQTAVQLATLVSEAVPSWYRHGRIHPATKTFQALRMAVNDELDALREFIAGACTLLASGGRLAIISFHSIEDRVVKHAFRALEEEGIAKRVNKKPLKPTREEQQHNPRARSAQLRIIEKT